MARYLFFNPQKEHKMTKKPDIIDQEIELALNLLINSIKLHQEKHKEEIIDELVMTTHSIRDYFKSANNN
jgi:hypothetical protein